MPFTIAGKYIFSATVMVLFDTTCRLFVNCIVLVFYQINQGYSYNLTAQLQKQFDKGFAASIAYTYGKSMALNDVTSSQNSSQWRFM